MPTSPAQELRRWRPLQSEEMIAIAPSTTGTPSRVSGSGWGLPSVAKREAEAVLLGRITCAMGHLLRKRRIVAPYTPDVYRLRSRAAGFQPEAEVRVVCTVCTGVCSRPRPGAHSTDQGGSARRDPIVSGGRYRCSRITTLLPRNDRGR